MPIYDYVIVDAFAGEPFTGNPCGVVPDAARLTDAEMQAIAREINLTETAFILPSTLPNAAVRFRTFTPSREMTLSGHSILAGVAALIRVGRFTALIEEPDAILPIETRDGILSARAHRIRAEGDEFLVWLQLPQPLLMRFNHDPVKIAGLLGIDPQAMDAAMPAMKTQDDDVILFISDYSALMEARPDFHGLAEFSRRRDVRIWCAATLDTVSESVHVHSRCFAPAAGIDEDAVTANIHGPLSAYLVVAGEVGMAGEQAAVTCIQSDSTGRAGLVRALVGKGDSKGYQAWISGQCFVPMTGKIQIPSQVTQT